VTDRALFLAAVALLIGALIRALKSDRIPINIPPRWRPVLALVLGQFAGVVEALTRGTPWRDALLGGLLASLGAMGGHDVVIGGMLGGRELGAPKAGS